MKIDVAFPRTIWYSMEREHVRIARIAGTMIRFDYGLETYTQWGKKLTVLGLSISEHDFHPQDGNGTMRYADALPLILAEVETVAELAFLAKVIRDCPPEKNREAIVAAWDSTAAALGLESGAIEHDFINVLEAGAVAA